ncbi:hypothetical protein [Arthrobacter sp. UYEF3]|uniref:hypothetical protein n=1 Tax=Arthrobacter sp. UYEF3 TaxID=1756365 RepID=UPI0033914C1A
MLIGNRSWPPMLKVGNPQKEWAAASASVLRGAVAGRLLLAVLAADPHGQNDAGGSGESGDDGNGGSGRRRRA